MRIEILGCGDAFGSGGRLNTCFHVTTAAGAFLLDCGATALPAMKRAGIDRNAIGLVLITHFHADHFGGLPFFILDAQFLARRTEPLVIAGPPGIAERFERVLEAGFPGAASAKRKFALAFVELEPGRPNMVEGIAVTAYPVRHGNPGGPCFGYRIACDGKVLAYSGDTEWTDALIDLGRDADLFIVEAYFRDKQAPLHLDYATLKRNLPRIGARRVLLTHMSDDMLGHAGEAAEEAAHDGLVLTL